MLEFNDQPSEIFYGVEASVWVNEPILSMFLLQIGI